MTGLHAVHVTAGLGVVGRVGDHRATQDAARQLFPDLGGERALLASIDIIWVLLYPDFLSRGTIDMTGARPSRRRIVVQPLAVWLALLALLAATAGLAYIPLGTGNVFASVAIGALKAVVIALFFMQLLKSDGTVRLASLAGFVFLLVLFLLSFADYLTRPTG